MHMAQPVTNNQQLFAVKVLSLLNAASMCWLSWLWPVMRDPFPHPQVVYHIHDEIKEILIDLTLITLRGLT